MVVFQKESFLLLLLCLSTTASFNSPESASVSSPLLSFGLGFSGDSAYISDFSFFGAGASTINLVKSGTSATQLLLLEDVGVGSGAITPRCCASGCVLASNASLVSVSCLVFSSPSGGLIATENWTVTLLNDSSFELRVDRVYTSATPVALGVDRLGVGLETTGGLPIHSQQIPGFVDLEVFLNQTSSGGFALGDGSYEFLSPRAAQWVRFTPTGALFLIEGVATLGIDRSNNSSSWSSGCWEGEGEGSLSPLSLFWSFAKPFADGTTWCNIGFEALDPRVPGGRALPAGTLQTLSMTFTLLETDVPTTSPALGDLVGNFPTLDVYLPNATLTSQMMTLMGVQYQLLGFLMGNNPASVPCLHEMAWWPLIASTFPAETVAIPAMQAELSFFAGCGWAPQEWDGGYEYLHSCNVSDGARHGLMQRYASSGFYNCPWGALQDEDVMFPIAVYYTAVASGDMAWLRSLLPALEAIDAFLASRGLDLPASLAKGGEGGGDPAMMRSAFSHAGNASSSSQAPPPPPPVVFVSPGSGLADGGKHSSNWYDVVLFGNLDAFIAVHGVWAMACLAEIYTALGEAPAAARASAIHTLAAQDFNALFWNASTAQYMDWIDIEGRARSYFYVDIPFTAIIAGVPSADQMEALLNHYDARLAEIYQVYNVTPGNIWSAPSNLYPIIDPLEYAGEIEGNTITFPSYENGGSFFHTPGLQFAALGASGRAEEAYTGFQALLNSGFGDVRGWAQQLYWGVNGTQDTFVGGDPLNTAALSIWGFLRATFGIAPTLTSGITKLNAPPPVAEGARWNFSYLGSTVCVQVDAGATRFCNGSAIIGDA